MDSGPCKNTEFRALIQGAETLRNALLKPEVYILDVGLEYEWVPRNAWLFDGNKLHETFLPTVGALLPTLSRQEFSQELAGLPVEPNLRIDGPGVGALGLEFRVLSDILDVFQRLWNAIGQALSPSGPKASGRPTPDLAERTALRLAAAGSGSLVLRVGPADMVMYQDVAERFEELVRTSSNGHSLAETLGRLGSRVQGRYSELLTKLAKHNLQMLAERPGGAVFLSASTSSRVLQELPQSVTSESRRLDIFGHFVGFDYDRATFTFYDEHKDETYSGTVPSEVGEAYPSVVVGIEVRYAVNLDLLMQTAGADRPKQTYTLRSITQIPRPPRLASDTGPFRG